MGVADNAVLERRFENHLGGALMILMWDLWDLGERGGRGEKRGRPGGEQKEGVRSHMGRRRRPRKSSMPGRRSRGNPPPDIHACGNIGTF